MPIKTLLRTLLLIALSGSLCFAPSLAGTVTNTFNVTANVGTTCNLNSITAPSAVALTAAGGTTTASGSFYVQCTNGDSYNAEMSPGLYGTDGATPTRYLGNGTNRLGYQIWINSNYTGAWGDTPGTNTNPRTADGTNQGFGMWFTFNVPAWTLPAAAYTDTITITIAY